MDKDDRWIVEHFSELVTKYAGKYVAVVNETLVAVGEVYLPPVSWGIFLAYFHKSLLFITILMVLAANFSLALHLTY